MEPVGEHPVPSGPLAVRWLAHELGGPRAGTTGPARVLLENAGSATWRSRGREGVQLAYHWLDDRGNPILWDGIRTAFPAPVAPGERAELAVELLAPMPPGLYRIAFDLVEEHRYWFAEVGSHVLELDVEVAPRIAARRLAAVLHAGPGDEADTRAALAAQEEPLVESEAEAVAHLGAGCVPAADWSRRVLDAHAEGFAAVGGSLEPEGGPLERRRWGKRLAAWAPGTGRNPSFPQPLLCPSLLAGLEPGEHEGLPAWDGGGPALYDGRIALRLRLRPGRPRG